MRLSTVRPRRRAATRLSRRSRRFLPPPRRGGCRFRARLRHARGASPPRSRRDAAARERWRPREFPRDRDRGSRCAWAAPRDTAPSAGGGETRRRERRLGASRAAFRVPVRSASSVGGDGSARTRRRRAFAEEVVDFVVRATRGADDREGIADQPRHSETALFGSAFVTFSRRTPASLRTAMRRRFAIHADAEARADSKRVSKPAAANASARDAPTVAKTSRRWVWDEQGPNPFEGAMAWADAVLVTADSASVLSRRRRWACPSSSRGGAAPRGKRRR